MKSLSFDAAVIGAGAAGMAAALELEKRGFKTAIIEREEEAGGILLQCIHNGFGLIEFNEELTGPEFAERFTGQLAGSKISLFCNTTVVSIDNGSENKELLCYSASHGIMKLSAKAVVLAMGCRERNRGNIRIPGDRPAGVFTAGLAQRLVNIEGYLPGREIVIIGSGDIGLIMARRMNWSGCKVHGVVEIQPYPSGLARNIVQCLNDFNIPLYISHQTMRIIGRKRVEGVEIAPIENGALATEKAFVIPCDTVLMSVGLVPENELSKESGIRLDSVTGGPELNSMLMTKADGVFACGNVVHVHDLVDYVVEEARRAGAFAAGWLEGERPGFELRVKAGANIRYISPGSLDVERENRLYFRSLVVKNNAVLELRLGGELIKTIKAGHVQPSEMIKLDLESEELARARQMTDPVLEVSLGDRQP